MEQNFNENEHNHEHNHCHCKEGCFKFALIFFATILGAFLAFYFVADYTLKMMFSPEYQMHRAEKMMRQMDRGMAKEFNKDIDVIGKMIPNPVSITENNDAYTVSIALKQFGNTAKNIKVNVDADNVLKIEGNADIKKGHSENLINLMQSYKLEKKVDFSKMTTKEEHGHYVVTIPFLAQ